MGAPPTNPPAVIGRFFASRSGAYTPPVRTPVGFGAFCCGLCPATRGINPVRNTASGPSRISRLRVGLMLVRSFEVLPGAHSGVNRRTAAWPANVASLAGRMQARSHKINHIEGNTKMTPQCIDTRQTRPKMENSAGHLFSQD